MVAIKTIGQVLKEKRTELGLGLSEAEKLTNVQKLYIVALETDDYKALPGEFYIKAYLKQYAEKLGLNAEEIVAAYEAGNGITVEDKDDIQETYRFVKPSERVEEEDTGPRTWRDYVPIILLSSVALAIVLAVVLAVVVNQSGTPSLASNNYHYSDSKKSSASAKSTSSTTQSSSSSSSSAAPLQKLSVTGSGTTLNANLTNAQTPVKIEISVAAGGSVWVYANNSDMATTGVTLSGTNLTTTGTLSAGSTASVITLGNHAGVSVTINGQALDLSQLGTVGPYKIYLTVNAATGTQAPTTQSSSAVTANANTTTAQ
ncbi:helix-turn-helix domain-containing protein [Lactococcus nasutitermitis]|uniref:Helix-turn-helix domain-containing protein n=1 Tax=Lactococcus nasutitermitis TaxID=1652957 RepID=A0ABV9JAQ8_9LACT|nr:helix-turn-helix domain-containing protein [Lactococcus nasutitermitis]